MTARPGPTLCAWLSLGFVALAGTVQAGDPSRPVEYNRDIRPILSENCFFCHGPDKGNRKADLRLDDRATALVMKAITPRLLEESELVARIVSDDEMELMPPPDSTKKLTDDQKELLKRWIAEGAEYQAHWAYEPVRQVQPPALKESEWVRNPVDAFILEGLRTHGTAPSPEAGKDTLIRRLSLDLTGLPPTPEQVAAFERDNSPNAYEKLVDRLLDSPHYGERMAVPWLDLVRFADTVGYHGDQNQNVFPYRDYVIDAFNANKPFDQFTVEQLAGDLIPDATPEQQVASAFNRLNMVTREGGAQPKEYLAKYTADRVRTVAITWLGSTMGCAECHDHKFDPFTAKDFYQMGAFFADVEQWGVYMDYEYTPNPDLRGYSNDHPFPPEIDVFNPHLKRRAEALDRQLRDHLATAARQIAGSPCRKSEQVRWASELSGFLGDHPAGWSVPLASVGSAKNDLVGAEIQCDGSIFLAGKTDPKNSYRVRLEPAPGWLSSIRLELLPDPASGGRFTRGKPGGVPVKLAATLDRAGTADKTQKLSFYRADANAKTTTFSNGRADLNIESTWWVATAHLDRTQTAVYVLDRPILVEAGDSIVVTLKADMVARVRLATSPISFVDPTEPVVDPLLVTALGTPDSERSPAMVATVANAFLLGTDRNPAALAEAHRLIVERAECHEGKARVVVTKARPPIVSRLLARGNWQDETGEVVEPGVPHFLPQPAEAGSRRLDRLDLARWITSAENPLTSRVFANRTWKQFFGTGLAAVMEDVGAQGEWPSHVDLLDWLAADFRDHGWNVKRLVKTLVMSATYRQSSKLRPELRDVDPSNRWLASQSPRRLDAEFVRDNALAIAGLLNPEIGGPSVFPYQPPGYYAAIQFPSRKYQTQTDERQYRRGVYSHWQRTFLHPMLANFDAPSREECIAARTVANTPQQALTLLNDPNFVAAARAFARSILADDQARTMDDKQQLNIVFERALARPIRDREQTALLSFLATQRDLARQDPAAARRLVELGPQEKSTLDPTEWAAWTEVCRVVLNLHETLTRY